MEIFTSTETIVNLFKGTVNVILSDPPLKKGSNL